MIERQGETWRPPLFAPANSALSRTVASLRRFLDLQAGSIWRDLAELLPRCHGLVLDVGCGAQPYRSLVHPEATYRGIDYAYAERHFGYSMPDTVYYEGDEWPVASGSVDVVLCTETLEHVSEPRTFLGEAFRCLKPGGRLILTVPFAARWHFIPHDYWRFTPSGLQKQLSAAGFTKIAVFARGNALTVGCYKVMALILPLLIPQEKGFLARLLMRSCGLVLSPILLILAIVANASMRADGGDDCLGYTVLAERADFAPNT
jgi:SAM-dependent methyltransferase